jgi:hypothetical protein
MDCYQTAADCVLIKTQLQPRKQTDPKHTKFQVADDGSLMMGQRLYVSNDETVKEMVLQEAHESKFSIHPGITKIYRDLKHHYWWPNMKRKIVGYVSKCGICQQVKVEHQRPARPLQPLQIPE